MRFKGWRHTQPKVFTRGVKRRPDQDRRPERRTGAEGSLRRRRFTRELKRASDRALRAGPCSAAFLSRVPVRRTRRHLFDFTPGLKWSMLEICPLALCAYGRRVFRRWQSHSWLCFVRREVATTCYRITSPVSAPFHAAGSATSARGFRAPHRWHSHSRLCSVQRANAVMRDRAASLRSALPRTADSATSGVQITTHLESNSCTNIASNLIRIILLRKNTRGHPLAVALCCVGPLFGLRRAE